jgi:tetratricopeptide (TPR) repeat protein
MTSVPGRFPMLVRHRRLPRSAICVFLWVSSATMPLHAQARGTNATNSPKDGGSSVALDALISKVESLSAEGKLRQALPLAQQAVQSAEELLGSQQPQTIRCILNLARLYQQIGQVNLALSLGQKALASQEAAVSPRPADLADVLDFLGSLHERQGQLTEAFSFYERSLAIRQKALAPKRTCNATRPPTPHPPRIARADYDLATAESLDNLTARAEDPREGSRTGPSENGGKPQQSRRPIRDQGGIRAGFATLSTRTGDPGEGPGTRRPRNGDKLQQSRGLVCI